MGSNFKYRRETHIVGARMEMYQRRDKWKVLIAKQKQSAIPRSVADGIKPRAVVIDIIYSSLDRSEPVTDNDHCFDSPGVTIREVSVDDGLTLREFSLSLDEAKKLAELLSDL
jgi:hypothetical protein